MGLKGSKPKLSKEDLEFLKKNTNFTEEQIKEWYKGFVVSTLLDYVAHFSKTRRRVYDSINVNFSWGFALETSGNGDV